MLRNVFVKTIFRKSRIECQIFQSFAWHLFEFGKKGINENIEDKQIHILRLQMEFGK